MFGLATDDEPPVFVPRQQLLCPWMGRCSVWSRWGIKERRLLLSDCAASPPLLQRKRKGALDIRTPFGAKLLSSPPVASNLEQKDKCGLNTTERLIWVEQFVSNRYTSKNRNVLAILTGFLKLLVVPRILQPVESRSSVSCVAGEWTGLLFLLNWASGSVQLHISSVGTGSRAQSSVCHRVSARFPFIRAAAVKSPYTNSDFMSGSVTRYQQHYTASRPLQLLYLRWCFCLELLCSISIPLRCH